MTFDANRSELSGKPEVTPETFEWTFADGTTTGPVVSHAFDAAGRHAVALTITYSDDTVVRAVEFAPVGTDLSGVEVSALANATTGGDPLAYDSQADQTPTETASPTPSSTETDRTSGSTPGFGVGTAVAGIAVVAYAPAR